MSHRPGETIAYRICPFCEAAASRSAPLRTGACWRRGHDADVFSGGYVCRRCLRSRIFTRT